MVGFGILESWILHLAQREFWSVVSCILGVSGRIGNRKWAYIGLVGCNGTRSGVAWELFSLFYILFSPEATCCTWY